MSTWNRGNMVDRSTGRVTGKPSQAQGFDCGVLALADSIGIVTSRLERVTYPDNER